MKKTLFALAFSSLTLSLLNAQNNTDHNTIKGMCGCFDVRFEYAETFSRDTNYHTLAKPYQVSAVEYVFLEEETPEKLVLQHLLVIDDSTVIKHWRQDWVYQPGNMFTFNGNSAWTVNTAKPATVHGLWAQKVYEVDDSPRYAGASNWVSTDGKMLWESTVDAPLPRREYTKRSDYQILQRSNRNIMTKWGWMHEQDNQKIILDDSGRRTLVEEKGWNTYTRTAQEKCAIAANWWPAQRSFWKNVRLVWDEQLAPNYTYAITKKVDGRYLGQTLNQLSDQTFKTDAEAQAAIREVIQKHTKATPQKPN